MGRIIIGHIININKTFWFSESLRYSCFFSSFLKWINNLCKGVESYNCSYFPYISIVWFYRSCESDLSCVKWYQSKPFLGSSSKLVHNNNHGEQQAWQSWFPYGGLSFWWPSEQHGRFEETSSAIFGASSMLQNSKLWWWKSRFLGCQPFSFSRSCGWARWRGVRSWSGLDKINDHLMLIWRTFLSSEGRFNQMSSLIGWIRWNAFFI